MRVGIDVAILSGPVAGIGFYTLYLVQALARVENDIEFVLLGAPPSLLSSIPHGKNFRVHTAAGLHGIRRLVWQQTELPRSAARAAANVLHCPDFSRPLFCSAPVINTIHDLSYYAPQPFFPLPQRIYKRRLARVAIGQSAAIITVSEFTRQEILCRFRIDERKVSVVHEGADCPSCEIKKDGRSAFILFVGTLEERKDVATLVRAFTVLRSQGRIAHRLILVGAPGFGWKKILAAIEASPCRSDIELRGYERREEVLRLYGAADLFVYPSVYEGFGLPVLEAMARGTPVICSRAASLPEVAGDAAEYSEPASVEGLAAAMERVLGSPERQAELRRKGLERVKLFSWDECARRHCEIYRQVLKA